MPNRLSPHELQSLGSLQQNQLRNRLSARPRMLGKPISDASPIRSTSVLTHLPFAFELRDGHAHANNSLKL